MKRPKIAISCSLERKVYNSYYMSSRYYARAIVAAGGLPFIIPNLTDVSLAEDYLKEVDGLLLSGGEDVAAWRFKAQPSQGVAIFDAERDAMEEALFRAAEKIKLPVLGVCRGMQYVNILRGGDLYQDLPREYPGAHAHVSVETLEDGFHTIDLAKDSFLYEVFQKESILVNSEHHQAVKNLGEGLEAVAWSEEGIIEALASKDDHLVWGVQFHPEIMAAKYPEFSELFKAFIGKCKENQG